MMMKTTKRREGMAAFVVVVDVVDADEEVVDGDELK